MSSFKVEIRKTCKICNKLITQKRFRTFCSKKCREKDYYNRYYDYRLGKAQERRGREKPGKHQCLICGKWYEQVCSHVWQVHNLSEHDYKIEFDLPLRSGILTEELHELKSAYVFENGTVENLKKGASKRYKKGDPRAKEVTGWKGRNGAKGFPGYES